MTHRASILGVAMAMALGMVSLFNGPPASAAPKLPPGFTIVNYETGQAKNQLTNFAWTGQGGLLTIGKAGRVTFVPSSGNPRILTTVPDVRSVDDHGLLGIALAGDYASSGRVFLSYDKGEPKGTGYGMLEEWKASPAANPTSFTKVRAVVDGAKMTPKLTQVGTTHGINAVVVAPDDTLFWGTGDNSGNNGDPKTMRAQDIKQPYGKIFHVTAAGAAVPTNPFYDVAAPTSWSSMVYAYGLRNPFRMSLDPRSGLLQVGDVGWRKVEEISMFAAGANGGWPCYEGTERTTFSGYEQCQALYKAASAVPPIWTYPHAGDGASVVGGELYSGTSYPAKYASSYFLGDYTRGAIWTLATDAAGKLTRAPEGAGFATGVGAPVAFHSGPNGDMTYADIASGQVRRLVYGAGNRNPVAQLSASTNADTRTVSFSAASSYDLDGDKLAYAWDFGDGATATGESVRHTYGSASPVTVKLTARDQLGAAHVVTSQIYPANHSPVLTLTAPPASRLYAVGDQVNLSAKVTDVEDGNLQVRWETVLKHCPFVNSCHLHPDRDITGATYSAGFTDHGADTLMEITVSATDAKGATVEGTYQARPDLKTLTVRSPVAVNIDGSTAASAQVVAGASVQVEAPARVSYRRFLSWSDGGAAAHELTMPKRDLNLTATYVTEIDDKYAAMGGVGSPLGKPVGVEYDVAGGRGRNFVGGRVLWSSATGAHEMHGKIATKFVADGGVGAFGFPTTDEVAVLGGRASSFTKSRIYHSAAGTHFSRGKLLAKYLEAGGPDGYGLPTTDDTKIKGGYYGGFTGGRSIYYSKANGTHLVYGNIRKAYGKVGYERSCLGFPKSDEYAVAGGRRSDFAGGKIVYTAATGKTRVTC